MTDKKAVVFGHGGPENGDRMALFVGTQAQCTAYRTAMLASLVSDGESESAFSLLWGGVPPTIVGLTDVIVAGDMIQLTSGLFEPVPAGP